jgi:hypothetical protein
MTLTRGAHQQEEELLSLLRGNHQESRSGYSSTRGNRTISSRGHSTNRAYSTANIYHSDRDDDPQRVPRQRTVSLNVALENRTLLVIKDRLDSEVGLKRIYYYRIFAQI